MPLPAATGPPPPQAPAGGLLRGLAISDPATEGDSPRRRWRAPRAVPLLLFAGFLLIGAALILTVGLSAADDDRGTRAPGDYQGYLTCGGGGCHDAQILGWNATRHATAWDDLQASGGAQDYCEVCHTTGAGDELHNGFNITTDQPDYLKDVQCEACHGPDPMTAPGGASTRIDLSAAQCGTCHVGEHHPYLWEWQNSTHALTLTAAGGEVATNQSCQGCHVAQAAIEETFGGGTLPRPITDPWPIVCAVCHDPHSNANEYQLRKPRAELCATCHNPAGAKPGEFLEHPQAAMREGLSAIPPSDVPQSSHMDAVLCADCHMYSRPYNASQVPPRITGHEFEPRAEACSTCHDGVNATLVLSVPESQAQIDAWQDAVRRALIDANGNVTDARRALQNAPDLGFNTGDIRVAQDVFELANYSLLFVDTDGSRGVHNPTYATALLQYANVKASEVLSLLQTGTISGHVLSAQGHGLTGVEIHIGGTVVDTTGAGGFFNFERAPGTYTLEFYKDGTRLKTVADVEVTAGAVTNLGEIETDRPEGIPSFWYLVVLIVVLALLFIFIFTRRPRDAE